MTATADAAAGRGETPMYVAVDDRLAAVVTVADTVKPESAEAIAQLRGPRARGVDDHRRQRRHRATRSPRRSASPT